MPLRTDSAQRAPANRARHDRSVAAVPFLVLPLLAACQDDGPNAADIEAAYETQAAAERAELLERYGAPEDVPGVSWGMASVRREVELTDCEKASDDRGHLCVYDLRLFAMGGDVEMEQISPIRDVEGRVYRVSDGWAVEEVFDEDEEASE